VFDARKPSKDALLCVLTRTYWCRSVSSAWRVGSHSALACFRCCFGRRSAVAGCVRSLKLVKARQRPTLLLSFCTRTNTSIDPSSARLRQPGVCHTQYHLSSRERNIIDGWNSSTLEWYFWWQNSLSFANYRLSSFFRPLCAPAPVDSTQHLPLVMSNRPSPFANRTLHRKMTFL